MKKWMLMSILSLLFGCDKKLAYVEGGLYVTPREEGGYTALKILKLDEQGVHIRAYSNTYAEIPSAIEEPTLYMAGMDRAADEPLGMGHLPLSYESFNGWKAVLIQHSTVTDEELEGYEMWKEANGGYF